MPPLSFLEFLFSSIPSVGCQKSSITHTHTLHFPFRSVSKRHFRTPSEDHQESQNVEFHPNAAQMQHKCDTQRSLKDDTQMRPIFNYLAANSIPAHSHLKSRGSSSS